MNIKHWKVLVLGVLFTAFILTGCSNIDTSTKQEETSASQSNVDNNQTTGESKTVLLNSGYEMPIIGLGT